SGAVNNFNDDALGDLEKYFNRFNNYNELISYKLGFHAEYTTSIDILKGISILSHKYKAPVYTHNSETASEVKACIERYGKTPTELMESLGLFDFGGGGYHCVHMSENDLDIFKRRGLYAVTNPASNCKLASGIAPLAKMSEMGVNLAIGTDGPASNNALDMFREMYLAYALQNISCCNAAAFSPCELLKMATSGGAMAMGLEYCNDIAVGKTADLIVIDLKQPNMQPINNIVKNIVYSGSKQNVALTMVNGKILYENGKFYIGTDSNEIIKESNKITEKLKA
ncbi:MAG TPA: amidohydrolase family protein, partial [Clostridia bacterium]|nr:amidohydrolase family protein [Clostridia bacterium]